MNVTMQQKAMQDIFALDDAVSQFESIGNELDLGLPTEEDDAPKSFDDMLEVNPSNEPMEFGENFMSEGDDMADKQTQQFVVDEFAKEAAKLPDGNISAADLTGICAIIQMNNHITGDVRAFMDKTINHAIQAQQQQNVSEAQPNGTVAQDIAKTGKDTAVDGVPAEGGDVGLDAPADGAIPAMDPIDPTAEPTLDANPADGLGADAGLDAGLDTGLDAGLDAGPDTGLDAGLDAGAEDPLASIDDSALAADAPDAGLDGVDAGTGDVLDGVGGEEDAKSADDLDNFLDADDSTDAGSNEKTADDTTKDTGDSKSDDTKKSDDKDNSDDKKDGDDDFNFEAIADKARGLVEGTDDVPVDQAAVDAGTEAGETQATADLGSDTSDTPIEECGATVDDDFSQKEAKIESIVCQSRMKMAAESAKAVLEAYNKDSKRTETMAQLESVVDELKQDVQIESIVANYAQESKKRAMLESAAEQIMSTDDNVPATETAPAQAAPAAPSVLESTMEKIDNTLKTSKKQSFREQADQVIAEFEAQQTAKEPVVESNPAAAPAAEPVVESTDPRKKKIDSILEGVDQKQQVEREFSQKLHNILESIQTNKSDAELNKQLDDLVKQVKQESDNK